MPKVKSIFAIELFYHRHIVRSFFSYVMKHAKQIWFASQYKHLKEHLKEQIKDQICKG